MNFTTRSLIARLASGAAVLAFAQQAYAAPQQQQQAPKPKQVKASAGAVKALAELQTAVKSKDQAAIQAKVAAATPLVSTPDDRYILAQLQLQAAADANNKPGAMAAMDAMLASGVLTPTEATPIYKNLSELRYEAKQYDQASVLLKKRLELNPNDVNAVALLAETLNSQGHTAEALAMVQRGIQLQTAAGRKPEESWLRRATALAYNGKLPGAVDLSRQWVSAYPSPSSWQSAIVIYRQSVNLDSDSELDLLRLMRTAGAMSSPMDYLVYLDTLNNQSNFIEAQTALDKAGALDASNGTLSSLVSGIKAKPRVTAADLEAASKTAASPIQLLRIGDRYYGLGDYSKAVALYQQAKAKGADANLVNERVGVALATSGDKAGATTALKAVTGVRAGVAQMWLLYLQGQA